MLITLDHGIGGLGVETDLPARGLILVALRAQWLALIDEVVDYVELPGLA